MTQRRLEWQLRNIGRGMELTKDFQLSLIIFCSRMNKYTIKTGTEDIAGRELIVPHTAVLSTP